jgi:hypothetical protein
MYKSLVILALSGLLFTPVSEGKFDGLSFGASIGGNIASIKEAAVTDSLQQLGPNGKVYVGIGKSLLDFLFVGAEAYGRYSFFMKSKEPTKATVEGFPQFGAYLKAGLRPTEDLLIYGVFGLHTNSAQIKDRLETLFESRNASWSTMVGAGIEVSVALGTAVRVEVVYEPTQNFELKDVTTVGYEANFLSLNLGVVIYL